MQPQEKKLARKLAFDRVLFTTVLLLVGLGLVMVYSASVASVREHGGWINPFLLRQGAAALLGLVAMVGVMHLDYRVLCRPPVVYTLVLGSLLLLVAALFSPELNNARRWIFVGPISIQPSEIAKLVAVIYVAYQVDRKRDQLDTWQFLAPVGAVIGLAALLILLGRDLGTALLLGLPALVLVFAAGIAWRFLIMGALALLPLLWIAVYHEPYRWARVTAFLAPEADPQGASFQLLQSLIAIGSGGVFGLGPGNSVQKLFFLPSPHADFIFAILAEELGLIGALALLTLFGVLLWRGVRAGLRAPDEFGRLLAWGLAVLLVGQALIHVSVAVALLPTTGVPLPFISHGGSSLVTSMVASGMLLNLSQHG